MTGDSGVARMSRESWSAVGVCVHHLSLSQEKLLIGGHDIISCSIPMGSVLGSFGAFQGKNWSVAPFIPVGPSENQ